MPQQLNQPVFTIMDGETPQHFAVKWEQSFSVDSWPEFETFYQEQIKRGVVHCEIDLQKVFLLTSRLLGLLIGLNVVLTSRQGSLTLKVQRRSAAANLLQLTRMNLIIPVVEV